MSLAIALLVLVVALGLGGYAPWATLVLEMGASALILWCLVDILWGTRPEERAFHVEQNRVWKKMPLLTRHPNLGTALHAVTLGLVSGKHKGPEVEILPPGGEAFDESQSRNREQYFFWGGYPFKRTGLGLPVILLTFWMVLSLVPLDESSLAGLSPTAHALRHEAQTLTNPQAGIGSAPWSLAPFFTLRSLWLWAAYLGLFYFGVHLAADPARVERLSLFLFVVGIAFGVWGVGQWAVGLQSLFGADPTTAGFRASGSFGNRNHYAAFMEMLLFPAMGWLGARWAVFLEAHPGSGLRFWRRVNLMAQEAGAKLVLAGLGVVALALGLIFSLSRSGISFALAGCAVFVLLAPRGDVEEAEVVDLRRRHTGRGSRPKRRARPLHMVLALGLIIVGVAAWIGLDPVLQRFELLPDEWEAEQSRWQVWKDSLVAVEDYYLTGSGLSSYRYIFPVYRSFGGTLFFSWAHNDYLQALIELGVPGFALIVVMMGLVGRAAHRVRRALAGESRLVFLHAGYMAAAIAVALHSFTDFGLHMPANGALFSVVIGVVVGLEATGRNRGR
jgi:O-antigen ligase